MKHLDKPNVIIIGVGNTTTLSSALMHEFQNVKVVEQQMLWAIVA